MKKRILAAALVLVMMVGLLPISALAARSGGDEPAQMEVPQGEESARTVRVAEVPAEAEEAVAEEAASLLEARKSPTPVEFSGTSGTLNANLRPNNLKSYTLEFDIDLPDIATAEANGAQTDKARLVIRNEVKDDYFSLYLATVRQSSGKYQIWHQTQMWNKSESNGAWDNLNPSGQVGNWSPNSDTPITQLHVVVSYDHEKAAFTWTTTNRETGKQLATLCTEGKELTEALKTCEACGLRISNPTDNVTVANATFQYLGDENIFDYDEPEFDNTKTPGDLGWTTDNNDFTNWQVAKTTSGEPLYLEYTGSGSQRIWKEIIQDPDDFTVTMDLRIQDRQARITVMGVDIDLRCTNGNGQQIFDPVNWDWFKAVDQACQVTIARAGGGDLQIKFVGSGNTTPMSYSKTPVNTNDKNVYIGATAAGDKLYISNVQDIGLEGQRPGSFGWETEEVSGTKDFSGWTTVDGLTIKGVKNDMNGTGRIWKSLIKDQNNFTLAVGVDVSGSGTAGLKVLGQSVELVAAGDDQVQVKINGSAQETVDATGCKADVYFIRGGGKLLASVVTEENVNTYTLTPSAESGDLELSVAAGTAFFSDIRVMKASADSLREVPFGTTAFVGDLAVASSSVVCRDISEYQKHTVQPVCDPQEVAADLVVISEGMDALLAGKDAATFVAEYKTKLTGLLANQPERSVMVITSLPYLTDEVLGDVTLETYAAYNANLRALADELDILYADIYSAMGEREWTWTKVGEELSPIGQALVAGEVLSELLRSCTCLAVYSSSHDLTLDKVPAVEKTQSALTAFKTASTKEAMRTAVENRALGLELTFWTMLESDMQEKVVEALLAADRSGVADFTQADALYLSVFMQVIRANPLPVIDATGVNKFLAVGASITQGSGAEDERTDSWVARFAKELDNAATRTITHKNRGIGGTRMCTPLVLDWVTYPAGKDTVDEYVVAEAPDLLNITYGFNDLNTNSTTKEEYLTTFEAYVAEVREKCPDVIILIGGIQRRKGNQREEEAKAWSAGLKEIAEKFENCVYVDTYEDMRDVEWLLMDGVHPDNAGYRVMANTYLRSFNAYMNLNDNTVVTTTPGDFDWETDEDDFSGWSAAAEDSITANYDQTAHNHRIWKPLEGTQDSFVVELDVTANNSSSVYVKTFGQILELDGRNGNGNQLFAKINGENKDWIACAGGQMHVKLEGKDGKITLTLTGKDNDTPVTFEMTPSEENENLEIGIYAGQAAFQNISNLSGEESKKSYTVTWNVDGVTTTERYEVGQTPSFKGSTAKASDGSYNYTFTGWSPAIKAVTGDVTYTAQYSKTAIGGNTSSSSSSGTPAVAQPKVEVKSDENGEKIAEVTLPRNVSKAVVTIPAADLGDGNVLVKVNADGTEEVVKKSIIVDGKIFAVLSENCTLKVDSSAKSFMDTVSHWAKQNINFAAAHELFEGTSETTFSPEMPMDRAMLATVLYRLETAKAEGTNPFSDVPENIWYTDAVIWANAQDIVSGTGNGFEPTRAITRQEMVVMLYNYAKFLGMDTAGNGKLEGYTDADDVADWAKDAMNWAVGCGLITGRSAETLAPADNATRAEVATVMQRLIQLMVK